MHQGQSSVLWIHTALKREAKFDVAVFIFFCGGVEVWEKEIVAAVTLRCASS